MGHSSVNSSSPSFYRGLSGAFLSALDKLANEPCWWRDILSRHDLVIAVRDESLNVYYRGASLFRITQQGEDIIPMTHAKYLARREQGLVPLGSDGSFELDSDQALWRNYAGPNTLTEMMAAAGALAGPEKIGLHPLLLSSLHVIDVEIAFTMADVGAATESADGAIQAAEDEATTATGLSSPAFPAARQDRLDVATLEEHAGEIYVVFHEAKHFSNPELRAAPERIPPVAEQIARYRQTLSHHAEAIGRSYRDVCQGLVAIDAMRRRVLSGAETSLHPLIARVANEGIIPTVDPEPRLVVFGFDLDQRNGEVWKRHRKRLVGTEEGEFGLKLYAVGNTQGRRGPAFLA